VALVYYICPRCGRTETSLDIGAGTITTFTCNPCKTAMVVKP